MRRGSPDGSHLSRSPSLDRPCLPISGATGLEIPCQKLPRQLWRNAGRSSRAALPSASAAQIWVHFLADVAAAEQALRQAEANSVASGELALHLKAKDASAERASREAALETTRAREALQGARTETTKLHHVETAAATGSTPLVTSTSAPVAEEPRTTPDLPGNRRATRGVGCLLRSGRPLGSTPSTHAALPQYGVRHGALLEVL